MYLCEFEGRPYSCYSATAWVRSDNGTGGRALVFRRPRRVVHIDALLSPAHRVRNAQLLELLAQSSVPLEAARYERAHQPGTEDSRRHDA